MGSSNHNQRCLSLCLCRHHHRLKPKLTSPSQPARRALLKTIFRPILAVSLPSLRLLAEPWSHLATHTHTSSTTAPQQVIYTLRHGPIYNLIRFTPFTLQLQPRPPCRSAVGRTQICPLQDPLPASNRTTTSPSHLTHTRPRIKPPPRRTALRLTNPFPLPKHPPKSNAPIPPPMEPPALAQHKTLAKCPASRGRSRHAPLVVSKR